jgi:small subunit ribosomal protein S20
LANTKSALKAIRVSERKQAQNKPVKSGLKTLVKKAQASIAAGNEEVAGLAVADAMSALDKAAVKGVIHGNNAARRKSRLMTRYNKLATKS